MPQGAMEKVVGIGGIFFRAKNCEALEAWYEKHLGLPVGEYGVTFTAGSSGTPADKPQTVWSLFEDTTEYFGPNPRQFMVNYRVASLDRMIAQLKAANIEILGREDASYGNFAWINDPEGNRIELWEPLEAQPA